MPPVDPTPPRDDVPTHPRPLRWRTDPNHAGTTTSRNLLRGLFRKPERDPVDLGRLLGGVPIEKNVVVEVEVARPTDSRGPWLLRNLHLIGIGIVLVIVASLAIARATQDPIGSYRDVERTTAITARPADTRATPPTTAATVSPPAPVSASAASAIAPAPRPTSVVTAAPAPRPSAWIPAPTSTLRMKGILEP